MKGPTLSSQTNDSGLVCKHLPYEARTQLVRASQNPGGPVARAQAIDQATTEAKRIYPDFFKKDPS